MTKAANNTPSQGTIVADAASALLDWDGNEVEDFEGDYEDYVNSSPSKEDLKRYRTPVLYWEVRYPGCNLQPYPKMGGFKSSNTGLWTARNAVQERAIRQHILQSTSTDPDELRLTSDEIKIMNGEKKAPMRFCQDCFFLSCSMTAVDLHETLNGHMTGSKPRKDDA